MIVLAAASTGTVVWFFIFGGIYMAWQYKIKEEKW
jgi:hypothetical protein